MSEAPGQLRRRVCASWQRHLAAGFGFALGVLVTPAASIELFPSADTTLIETSPTNNMGGQTFVNVGSTGLNPPSRNRGLMKFDVAAAIPKGARIDAAELRLEVVRIPANGFSPSVVGLHRVLRSWGEGTKTSEPAHPGLGRTAAADEATWLHRFAESTNTWAQPGGVAEVDYIGTSSSRQILYGTEDSPYAFVSSAAMRVDVQRWLDQPELNFGWMLICEDEDVAFTARRIGSREDQTAPPILSLRFTAPPTISGFERKGDQVEFRFEAHEAQSYFVDFKAMIIGSQWQRLTNIPPQTTATNAVVSDRADTAARFYRVGAE